MLTFLLIVQAVIAASLVGVILMQRSEGGGLGVGSSSAGLMTARGAADFLTRATAILATLFVGLSIFLAGFAAMRNAPRGIDTSLAKQGGGAPASAPVTPGVPGLRGSDVPLANDDPLAGVATEATGKAPPQAAPRPGQAQTNSNQGVPLAQ